MNCILYFLRRSFQLNSRNLEMNVNSVEVTNFRQILTSRAINYGNVRFISSRDLTKYFANMPPSLSISAQGRGEEHFSSVKLCFQNMDERLAGRIVLKYHSSCWFSLFLLLVFHSPVISAEKTLFDFETKSFYYLFVEFTKRK